MLIWQEIKECLQEDRKKMLHVRKQEGMMEEEARGEQCGPSGKLTPLQLRERYHLTIGDLAWEAKVDPQVVYFMLLGRPITRQQAEQILQAISKIAGQAYTLEQVQVALTSEEPQQGEQADEPQEGVEEKMNIALLAWGSLIWEPRGLALVSTWELCGPEMPLEFSRVSLSRGGALTLVIDAVHGVLLPASVAISAFQTLDEAIENVGEREGGGPGCVGYVKCYEQTWRSRQPPSIISRIATWGRTYGFGAVIWTDLEPNFAALDKTQFSDSEPFAPFTVEHAQRYLHGLRAPGDALARAYISKAPAHIETPLRQRLASDPWLLDGLSKGQDAPEANTTGSPDV